jgi:hypothetical protein
MNRKVKFRKPLKISGNSKRKCLSSFFQTLMERKANIPKRVQASAVLGIIKNDLGLNQEVGLAVEGCSKSHRCL